MLTLVNLDVSFPMGFGDMAALDAVVAEKRLVSWLEKSRVRSKSVGDHFSRLVENETKAWAFIKVKAMKQTNAIIFRVIIAMF